MGAWGSGGLPKSFNTIRTLTMTIMRSVCLVTFILLLQVVHVKKMKADEIGSLLDSLGFYKRSQKGEEVPEEFKHFPLNAPRDEL